MITNIEGYLMDDTPEVVHGAYDLNLVVGNKYRVSYGVHQGIYEYVGKVSDKDENHIHSQGSHFFRSCATGKISFGYFGYTSPYEFATIVRPL